MNMSRIRVVVEDSPNVQCYKTMDQDHNRNYEVPRDSVLWIDKENIIFIAFSAKKQFIIGGPDTAMRAMQ